MKCESNVNSLTNNIFDNLCSECKPFSEKNKKCKNYAISKTKPLSFEKKIIHNLDIIIQMLT